MQQEQQTENKKSNRKTSLLDLQLIGKDYAQYQNRPEMYLITKIEKNNPWPNKKIAEIIPFLQQITALYNNIPYHNITHAFDVMVHLDLYFSKYGWQQRLAFSQQKAILMLIAAYAHDSGHQGFTNAFYKNSEHPLSLGSSSPLQSMHVSNLTRLLHENGLEIDSKIKQQLVQMILKTDNFYHHQLTLSAKNLRGLSNEQLRKPKNAVLIQCLLLHAADLNNTAKQAELTLIWTTKLYEEFQHQNKLQKDNNLPLTCILGSQQQRIRSNISFLDHLALPLFKCIEVIEPKFEQIITKVQKNKEYYAKSVEKINF